MVQTKVSDLIKIKQKHYTKIKHYAKFDSGINDLYVKESIIQENSLSSKEKDLTLQDEWAEFLFQDKL